MAIQQLIFVLQKKLFTMKKIKKNKEFDAVKFMREVRTAISKETEGMNFKQLKEYFAKRRLKYADQSKV